MKIFSITAVVVSASLGATIAASVMAAATFERSAAPEAPGMVFVPGGPALLGDDNRHAMPGPAVYEVGAFLIDRFETTNRDYAAFVAASGRAPALFSDDAAFNRPDQPVTGVTWQDAQDYCKWAGKRLPLEVEWEKAARGVNGRTYPWGYRLDLKLAHVGVGETPVRVTSHPDDESPYGVRGMAGNISEWVLNRDQAHAGICGEGNHHHGTGAQSGDKSSVAEAVPVAVQPCAYIKGNSWSGLPHMTKLANRMWDYTDAVAEFVGFRCVKSVR